MIWLAAAAWAGAQGELRLIIDATGFLHDEHQGPEKSLRQLDPQKLARAFALNAMIDTVQDAVAKGDKVTLPGFGAWSQSQRSARQGRNPRTGEIVQIPASKGVKFSAGAKFKAAVK